MPFSLLDGPCRARAIRLLFQPMLVLWALISTTAMPKGSFKHFWSYIKKKIRENRLATVIGILIGGVGTRFLEDGNLWVTTIIKGLKTGGVLVVWSGFNKLIKPSGR